MTRVVGYVRTSSVGREDSLRAQRERIEEGGCGRADVTFFEDDEEES